MESFNAGSYNVFFRSPYTKVEADLELILPTVDIIGFQEFADKEDREQLARLATKHGFSVYRGQDPGVPIAWRNSEFQLADAGSEFLTPKTKVLARGAGPTSMGRKDAVWVRLLHIASGRTFFFVNAHFVPSIQYPERKRLHVAQTYGMAALISRFKKIGNVIFVGDLNIDYEDDAKAKRNDTPRQVFAKIGVISTWQRFGTAGFLGTNKSRHIDYQYYTVHPARFWPVKQQVLAGFNSDHKPLVVTYLVSTRANWNARLQRVVKAVTKPIVKKTAGKRK